MPDYTFNNTDMPSSCTENTCQIEEHAAIWQSGRLAWTAARSATSTGGWPAAMREPTAGMIAASAAFGCCLPTAGKEDVGETHEGVEAKEGGEANEGEETKEGGDANECEEASEG
jgi:hypothetical protein